MAEWMKWFEGMGKAAVDPGNPVGKSSTVTDKGVLDHGGANPLSGYSIVEARDLAAAIKLAQKCPILPEGNVEVAQIMEM